MSGELPIKPKLLVLSVLRSQIDYSEVKQDVLNEPRHPYNGKGWAYSIIESRWDVEFINQVEEKESRISRIFFRGQIKMLYKALIISNRYDAVIAYSTNGQGWLTLLRLFRKKPALILYYLSRTNPDGNKLKASLRRWLSAKDCKSADKIIYGLADLRDRYPLTALAHKNNSLYVPFCVDNSFFNQLKEKQPVKHSDIPGLPTQYILVTGDITRDDEYLYSDLKNGTLPIIRVSRDPIVIARALRHYDPTRGDLVLSKISFEELAFLYSSSTVCIAVSSYDHWQPGGITAIAEALSCGAICLANSGGCLEWEFTALSKEHDMNCPVDFFEYPKPGALRKKLEDVIVLSNQETISKKAKASVELAQKAMDISFAYQTIKDVLEVVRKP